MRQGGGGALYVFTRNADPSTKDRDSEWVGDSEKIG